MPNREMMKVTARNGIMLSWGWLPPAATIDIGFIGDTAGCGEYSDTEVGEARIAFCGDACAPPAVDAINAWE
jgi:hypothetical protein